MARMTAKWCLIFSFLMASIVFAIGDAASNDETALHQAVREGNINRAIEIIETLQTKDPSVALLYLDAKTKDGGKFTAYQLAQQGINYASPERLNVFHQIAGLLRNIREELQTKLVVSIL